MLTSQLTSGPGICPIFQVPPSLPPRPLCCYFQSNLCTTARHPCEVLPRFAPGASTQPCPGDTSSPGRVTSTKNNLNSLESSSLDASLRAPQRERASSAVWQLKALKMVRLPIKLRTDGLKRLHQESRRRPALKRKGRDQSIKLTKRNAVSDFSMASDGGLRLLADLDPI
jgi:hypothetical protein